MCIEDAVPRCSQQSLLIFRSTTVLGHSLCVSSIEFHLSWLEGTLLMEVAGCIY